MEYFFKFATGPISPLRPSTTLSSIVGRFYFFCTLIFEYISEGISHPVIYDDLSLLTELIGSMALRISTEIGESIIIITQTFKLIKTEYQKFIKTSTYVRHALSVWKRALVQGLTESRITIRGDKYEGPLSSVIQCNLSKPDRSGTKFFGRLRQGSRL